tara:strand:+ start:136 stop:2001 length:1866 start_codon:yes stop_codon:yes gene_type:complete
MLRALRNQTKSIFFKCFLFLLICGFALWGVGDLTGGYKGKDILSVESQSVTVEEVLNEINRARYLLPNRPSIEDAIKEGIHKNILNKFEQEILINAEAKHLSLNVPLSQQMKIIRNEKAFKDPLGKFSQNKFITSLQNAGLSEVKYIEMIKTEKNFKQISMPFMSNDYYNEKIVKKIIDWQNEIRDIEYETFKIIDKNEVKKPSDKILKSYYKKNINPYKIPVTRDINYIEIKPSFFENQVVLNKKQIDEKYEIEKSNYIKEETREILQITTQDQIKSNEFLELIMKGKNFEELANKIFKLPKEDINIGYIKKSDLPMESAELIFNSKLNETLGPIKTKFGLSIYKVINISPKNEINYEEVIKDVKKKLTKELSLEILYEKLDEIEDLIAEGNTIDEISKSNILKEKVVVKNIKNISKQGLIYSYIKDLIFLDKNEIFLKNIWSTDIGELSEIFNSNDDLYYLIQVVKENNKETPNFSLVKNKVYNNWLENELILKTKERANDLILSKNNKLSYRKTIKRTDKNFANINGSNLINKIFEIKNKELQLISTKDNILAVRVKNSRTDNYTFNKKIYDDLNISFSKSFFNDFSNIYIKELALKHKLKRNYEELDNYVFKSEVTN